MLPTGQTSPQFHDMSVQSIALHTSQYTAQYTHALRRAQSEFWNASHKNHLLRLYELVQQNGIFNWSPLTRHLDIF